MKNEQNKKYEIKNRERNEFNESFLHFLNWKQMAFGQNKENGQSKTLYSH